ncbi:MAG: chemotaxis protein CheB, partial [Chloroflexi bacterium]|nr:chemotaxis protein CheB [Chloroflexota bacterium]
MPHLPEAHTHDVVVVAASAGGVEALIGLIRELPSSLQAAVFIVLHLSESEPSYLAHILDRRSPMTVRQAEDRLRIRPGEVYTAVPGRHLMIERGRMRVTAGPRENGHRPSADVLFRTAAEAYGPRVLGIVLSGADDDGTAGLTVIKRAGGTAAVQDPEEALYPRMPTSALVGTEADFCLGVQELAQLVARLTPEHSTLGKETPVPDSSHSGKRMQPVEDHYQDDTPAVYTCPECHGTLWEVDEGGVVRFRCRVGHAYTAEHLLSGQGQNVESALWMALRTLEERQQLGDKMAKRATEHGLNRAASRFRQTAGEARKAASTLRDLLLNG